MLQALKKKSGNRSYIHLKKFESILLGTGLEIASKKSRQYFPFHLFYFGDLLNKFFEISLYFLNFGIRNYIIIRKSNFINKQTKLTKSVIVPAKNEEGNLEELINRIPNLGKNNEIIISCGNSQDRTFEVASSLTSEFYNIKVIKQSKDGKANAVWEALDVCKGDVVAILDADISVEPEKLKDFFEIIEHGRADFVNGTRLMYPMEDSAMGYINKLGNRSFQNFLGNCKIF